jgi:hypothetical protein
MTRRPRRGARDNPGSVHRQRLRQPTGYAVAGTPYQQPLPCPVPGVHASVSTRLPEGFNAVHLWRCTYQFPRFGGPQTASPGRAQWAWRTVDRAAGAFAPVISALRATPRPARQDASHVCPASAILSTTVVFIDRAGKAITPAYPQMAPAAVSRRN